MGLIFRQSVNIATKHCSWEKVTLTKDTQNGHLLEPILLDFPNLGKGMTDWQKNGKIEDACHNMSQCGENQKYFLSSQFHLT